MVRMVSRSAPSKLRSSRRRPTAAEPPPVAEEDGAAPRSPESAVETGAAPPGSRSVPAATVPTPDGGSTRNDTRRATRATPAATAWGAVRRRKDGAVATVASTSQAIVRNTQTRVRRSATDGASPDRYSDSIVQPAPRRTAVFTVKKPLT